MNAFIRTLGAANWLQAKNLDHSCYTVADKLLVDANPGVCHHLLESGVDPADIKTVFFTHMHADHIMGLAPFFLYHRAKTGRYDTLTLYGPESTVQEAVKRILAVATFDAPNDSTEVCGSPRVIGLKGGDRLSCEGFTVHAFKADHAVPALCYRFREEESGKSVCFTGDTRYVKEFSDFFRDTDLLVHEASAGPHPVGPSNEISRHSGVYDALAVARECGAKRLMLTHIPVQWRDASLQLARGQASLPVSLATPCEISEF